MDEVEFLRPFLTSLGIGLLMGLERERSLHALAGMRTFPLVAALGTLFAALDQFTGAPWLVPAGLLTLGTMMVAAYFKVEQERDPGTTTTVAVLICFALGVLSWHGYYRPAVGIALAATALMYFRDELHGFASRLARDDLLAVMRFIVISVLVLPLLPDRGFGPYAAINPYRLWLMVILISGLSLGGYLTLQLIGGGRGLPLLSLLGGLASSTATTFSYARHARRDPGQIRAAEAIVLGANLAVLLRLSVLAAVLCPTVLPRLLPAFAGAVLLGVLPVRAALRAASGSTESELRLKNPGELREALGFALLFGVVLLLVAALEHWIGESGVYLAAAVSGLTDMDAISLSAFKMLRENRIDGVAAVTTVVIAFVANLLFKAAAAGFIAGCALFLAIARGFAAMAAGMALGHLLGTLILGS